MTHQASFPTTRLRRNRREPWLRDMLAETRLSSQDLIWPVFVCEGNESQPIATMPGVSRYPISAIASEVAHARDLGIPAIALFPATPADVKTDNASEAFNDKNLICRATQEIKTNAPGIGIITDVALDPYTSHGHDGLLVNGAVDNDSTLEALCTQAVTQARAGADIIAPSDMMDGRIGAIRAALDAERFEHVAILAYAAKYASAFYGPFRDAVGSKGSLGKSDKRSYQMNPANAREALREVALDINEGADMVMVKPGLPYLDIIRDVSREFPVPVLAYQVSGEYAMLKAASTIGAFDFTAAMLESLLALKRAGAQAILTYAAREMAEKLK